MAVIYTKMSKKTVKVVNFLYELKSLVHAVASMDIFLVNGTFIWLLVTKVIWIIHIRRDYACSAEAVQWIHSFLIKFLSVSFDNLFQSFDIRLISFLWRHSRELAVYSNRFCYRMTSYHRTIQMDAFWTQALTLWNTRTSNKQNYTEWHHNSTVSNATNRILLWIHPNILI